jgi:alpha-L-fucosidase
MNKTLFSCIAIFALCSFSAAEEPPLAPPEYRRPENYNPVEHRYKYSLLELQKKFSDELMQRAEKDYNDLLKVNADGKWKPTYTSLKRHQTPEWFQDIKFGMFIDWGPWSVAGYAYPKPGDGPIYADWYEHRLDYDDPTKQYHIKNWGADFKRDDLIALFKAKRYNPEKLVDIAVDAGMKYIVPFSKCHSGFCLWDSSYTHRDCVDMGPGKDLTKPLADLCKEKGLKFGFYFSTVEYEYPIIAPSGTLKNRYWYKSGVKGVGFENLDGDKLEQVETLAMGKVAVRDFLKDYLIPQAKEYIDKYDPDLVFYDGEWYDHVEMLGSLDISAYFYNRAEGRKEVAVNDRYGAVGGMQLRGYLGDIYTSEYHNKETHARLNLWEDNEPHAWEENRSYSRTFSFNWTDTDETVLNPKQFIDMFIDVVAKGGNFLLITGLDGQGAVPELLQIRLRETGKWLRKNGEAIYATRKYSTISEGDTRYTQSKDGKTVYAISLTKPEKMLTLKSVQPAEGSKVYLLGHGEPLQWSSKGGMTEIVMPKDLPDDYAYTLKILVAK